MIEANEPSEEPGIPDQASGAAPPGPPVVVIEYRSRGLPWYLAVPLLVLIPLGAVSAYHRVMSRGRFFAPVQEPAGPQAARPADGARTAPPRDPEGAVPLGTGTAAAAVRPDARGPEHDPAPLALNSQPIASGPSDSQGRPVPALPSPPLFPVPTPLPAPLTLSSPTRAGGDAPPAGQGETNSQAQTPRPPLAIGFQAPKQPGAFLPEPEKPVAVGAGNAADPAARVAGLERAEIPPIAPDDRRPPTRDQLNQDLREEAATKHAELENLKSLKSRARAEIVAESRARIENERAAFRRELQEILKTGNRKAGEQIDAICNKYGRNYDDELRARVRYFLGRLSGRTSREGKINLLRSLGVPEPGILDFLANDLHRSTLKSRNGPRDTIEVSVAAAKLLLASRPAIDAPVNNSLQARTGRFAGGAGPATTP